MRQELRCLGGLTAAALAAGGLAACGLVKGETLEDNSTMSGKITSVRLENGSGGVTVNGTEGSGRLSLRREIEYRGDKPQGATHRIENGVLILGGCGSRCSVGYTVDVPAGVPVSGEVSSGRIHLTEVGAVKVTTGSGRIEMNGVSGAVEVKTSNGRITGEGLRGTRIQAQTSNGAISLNLAIPLDVQAKTSNGDITLTLPKADYQVTADTNNGDKTIGVSSDPSGEYRLGLKSSNGDITVKKS
ncbi:lipoprotein [Streptomyces caelestis]|uniref:Lipoprotein n=1 Tax=Streptomyces caelestis TaxID=36816 RepID=A0A0M8QHD5_9ACTN|nr:MULTISPECIES: DUF4097 family beta strand repeat-containing protein [Streptomyces]KOT36491.1 lipoprotein [Streptomyces caelestis]KOV28345.1 lipoprotein [Streptomyces sp. XY152]